MSSVADKFEHWMQAETSYALQKFSPDTQYAYFDQGVARGSFSFKASALNYMARAALFEKNRADIPEIGLKVTQSLGKATHNLIALDAVAGASWLGRGKQLRYLVEVADLIGSNLRVGRAPTFRGIQRTQQIRGDHFDRLQAYQDENNVDEFQHTLQHEIQIATNMFVSAAQAYGWPEPGRTSGDVEPMTSID